MKPAVVVIEMQKKVYQTDPKPFEAEAVIQSINSVCQQARANSVPVIFSRQQRYESITT
jgi:nicotinamidase-related amidase